MADKITDIVIAKIENFTYGYVLNFINKIVFTGKNSKKRYIFAGLK